MTLLFLGAGASAPFGYPTMVGLNDQLTARIHTGGEGDLLLQFLPVWQSVDPLDIEEVLQVIELIDTLANRRISSIFAKSFIELSLLDRKQAVSFPQLVKLCRSLRESLQDAIFDVYHFRSECRARFELYTQLFSSLNFPGGGFQEYSVFTTNYDRLVEELCASKPSFELRDGFSYNAKAGRHFWDPDSFDAPPTPNTSTVRLHKLHGSLNWKVTQDGIERVSPEIRIPEPKGMLLKDTLLYPGSKERPDQEPFMTLYDRFEAQMKTADRCLVVGYSFRDAYLNRIFRDFLGRGQLICMSKFCRTSVAKNLLRLKDIEGVSEYTESARLVAVPAHFGEENWTGQLRDAILNIPPPSKAP